MLKEKSLIKEACWAISNICAGNERQVQAIIGADIFPRLIQLMKDDQVQEIRREAAWAISNASSGGNALQIKYIVSKGAIKALCELLDSTDNKTLLVALEGLENILRAGEEDIRELGENRYSIEVERSKGVDKIEELQNSNNVEIFEKSNKIIEEFFSFENTMDDDSPSMMGQFDLTLPSTSQNTIFKFNFT